MIGLSIFGSIAGTTLRTIHSDDWKRELKAGRETPNSISLQIKMKLNPANPTPGTPANQPPVQPVTTKEILDVIAEVIVSIQALESTVFLPHASRTKHAWEKLNNLRSRL